MPRDQQGRGRGERVRQTDRWREWECEKGSNYMTSCTSENEESEEDTNPGPRLSLK